MITTHSSYIYASKVVKGKINSPKYVKLQCAEFLRVANGNSDKYIIDEKKVKLIDNLLKLMIMPKGLQAGKIIYECIAGFQFLFFISILCIVYKDNLNKRRYEKAVLEICRKNGKTFLIALIFILLFFLEPKFSKFYSVAPDGSLSREVQEAIKEIISSSPLLTNRFKIRRDDILCKLTENKFIPLNYSNSRLDGKLPNVFLVDETGALPNAYAIEAMSSGQLTILNKLGCIISTKYPTHNNPFEDEVGYCMRVLDGIIEDDKVFALLYEPDDKRNWESNDEILEQANPLALEVPEIMDDLLSKRQVAIEIESKRENFITKHCNIVYQGVGTESYVSVQDLREGVVENINWEGKEVWIGLDLALTNDNVSVNMVSFDDDIIISKGWAFIPSERIEAKNKFEHINYYDFIKNETCYACGDNTIDYKFVEDFVMELEERYKVTIVGIGYDRYNCLSTAQKLENVGYRTVEVKQHSSVLHMPTKLLKEKIESKKYKYEENKLEEINFENARCTEDTNRNKYVNKKKSNGKVDMVVSKIIATYLMQQDTLFGQEDNFGAQVG